MQSLFGNSVWTACLESCLEDRQTDRPTNRLLEAPSRSLKIFKFSFSTGPRYGGTRPWSGGRPQFSVGEGTQDIGGRKNANGRITL